jgi:hypothetical protein
VFEVRLTDNERCPTQYCIKPNDLSKQLKFLTSSLYTFLQPFVTASLMNTNIHRNTLLSNILNPQTINSVEQSTSSEANICSTGKQMSRLLSNPKAHYHVHKSPPLDRIQSHLNPIHTLTPISLISVQIRFFHFRLDTEMVSSTHVFNYSASTDKVKRTCHFPAPSKKCMTLAKRYKIFPIQFKYRSIKAIKSTSLF